MELIKMLELAGQEWKLICSQRDPGAHHHQLGLEIVHHELQEIVAHLVELFFIHFAIYSITELVAHAGNQRIHGRHFFDVHLFDFATQDVFGLGQSARYFAVRHEFHC